MNDRLSQLLIFIGAPTDASAASVTALVPGVAYAHKYRRPKARDPVTTRQVVALFEAVGTDLIRAMDVHNVAARQKAFR